MFYQSIKHRKSVTVCCLMALNISYIISSKKKRVLLFPPHYTSISLEIVFTRAAPAFDNLFMGCVFNINTVHKTVEKLTFQAFY